MRYKSAWGFPLSLRFATVASPDTSAFCFAMLIPNDRWLQLPDALMSFDLEICHSHMCGLMVDCYSYTYRTVLFKESDNAFAL